MTPVAERRAKMKSKTRIGSYQTSPAIIDVNERLSREITCASSQVAPPKSSQRLKKLPKSIQMIVNAR